MGNYPSKGDSYSKGESDRRYPEISIYDAAIKASNDGLAQRYTKTESDSAFLKKVDAANLYQPIGGEYAKISFVNDKFSGLEKSIKTQAINLGDYSIETNAESQLCLKRNDGSQSFCFDGKIVIQK